MRRLVIVAVFAFALAAPGSALAAPMATSNVSVNTDPGRNGAVVNYTLPTYTTDAFPIDPPGASCTPARGSFFPVGTTTVNCSGMALSCLLYSPIPPIFCMTPTPVSLATTGTFTVTVRDAEPPALAVPASQFASTAPGAATAVVSYPPPVATDNVGVTGLACIPASGSAFPIGVTTVNCTASDAAGNHTSRAFTVTVAATPATVAPSTKTAKKPACRKPLKKHGKRKCPAKAKKHPKKKKGKKRHH